MVKRRICSVFFRFLPAIFLIALPAVASAQRLEERFSKTYPVADTVRFSLSNVNGGIQIDAWERNEIQVEAVKYASSREKLNAIRIEIDAGRDSLAIRTRYAPGFQNDRGEVEYKIHVPRTARLGKIENVNGEVDVAVPRSKIEASSVNGNVTGQGLGGDVHLSTVNGSVKCEMVDFSHARQVQLESVNGQVEFHMPRDANIHLTASSVNGRIQSDFDLPIKKRFVGRNVDTTLGSGSTRVDISTVNGGISIQGGSTGI